MTLFATERRLRPLRPRQAAAIADIRLAIREGHKRIICQAPTGFGKTLLSAHIISAAVDKGNHPMFVAPAISLINQTVAAFEHEGICDIGVIQAQHPRTNMYAQVQVASVQTLVRRGMPKVYFAIIDECHSRFKKLEAMLESEEWKDRIVIGLSATPWTKGLGLIWTKLIVAATTRQLMDEGWLTPVVGYGPGSYRPNLSGVKTVAGEFDEAGTARVMGEHRIVGNAVREWREKGTPDRTFMFAVNRAHAQALQAEFLAQGINCGYIDGNCDSFERKEIYAKYRAGEYKILSSVGVLTTGIDEDVRCIIDCAPTKSEMTLVQRWGRGVRLAEGKEHLIGLDLAGNNERLGMFYDIHHDHLDKRQPGEKGEAYEGDKPTPKPKSCGKCNALLSAGSRSCPRCGNENKAENMVQHEDGELVMFGQSAKKKSEKPKPTDKAEFYSQLLGYAHDHGKSTSWALANYHEKFKEWPYKKNSAVPTQPQMEVLKWVHGRRIAFIKGKQAQQKRLAHQPWGGLVG